jgi:hypothetical protein
VSQFELSRRVERHDPALAQERDPVGELAGFLLVEEQHTRAATSSRATISRCFIPLEYVFTARRPASRTPTGFKSSSAL